MKHSHLDEAQGSSEERANRILLQRASDRALLTKRFAKNIDGMGGLAGQQVDVMGVVS